MLTSTTYLEALLRRPLTEAELGSLPLLEDAALLEIESYTGADYSEELELPRAVRAVLLRVLARALNADPALENVSQYSETNGPYSRSRSFSNGSGGVYLGKYELKMLSKLRKRFGVIRLANY